MFVNQGFEKALSTNTSTTLKLNKLRMKKISDSNFVILQE